MRLLEGLATALSSLQVLVQVVEAMTRAAKELRSLARLLPSPVSYENLLLDVVLDISDPRGQHAVVNRRQSVRFLTSESGVIRDVIWGEGEPFADYSVEGAQCLGVRSEGSKRVALLGLADHVTRGQRALVRTRRVIRNALTSRDGYAEVLVERPTQRLGLKVVFPRLRPPREARLAISPTASPARKVPIRYGADGRAYLTWRKLRPEKYVTYGLRWSW